MAEGSCPAGCPETVVPSCGPLGHAPATWLVFGHTAPLTTTRMMKTLLTLGTAHILIHLSQYQWVPVCSEPNPDIFLEMKETYNF